MSVIGFDIGNKCCVIAAAKRGDIDVLLNDESQRETPAMVSFGEKQRFIGSALAAANPKSTIVQIKRLIGKRYNEVQEELKLLAFVTVEGPRGGVLIEFEYLKQKWTFTPVEILGMLFTHLKQIGEKNLESPVVDCVIGIPAYFTDLQRRQYLDAANIGGLKPLQLLHDGTAIALGYGMYKTDFSDSGPAIVMFVDIGHSDTQVTVAAFELGKMNILSHSFDQNLGGRDFDEVLYKHFAAEFGERYNIDVFTDARASVRLRASCEKAKKVLSANAEAQISIECLIGDTDVRGVITRDEFENLSSELLERVRAPCITALEDSGLSVDKLSTVELVGSGSRIPAITRVLTSFFQKEPARTLNGSECVARGCALRCAMLSPTLRVRDYKVQESFPYSIVIPSPDRDLVLFSKGCPFPHEVTVGYTKNNPFSFEVAYTNLPGGVSPMIGGFMIGSESESCDEVELRMLVNKNGIIRIGSAGGVKHMTALWKMITNRCMLNLPFSENLQVSTTHEELSEAQKKEKILADQDLKVEQTKDQRNTLESYVYDTRSKLSSTYNSFATDSEKEVIVNTLKETEEWLYEDSDDESEQDYAGKFENLKKLLEPIENKYHENARAIAEEALVACVAKYRELADLLPSSYKDMVKTQCINVEQWLKSLDQHASPTYINAAIKGFESYCIHVMRSTPSFLWHDEPVGPDQRHQLVDSDQWEQPVDLDQGMQSVDSDQWVSPLDSDQEVQSVDSDQGEQPMDSDLAVQPMDPNLVVKPMDSDLAVQPVELDQGVKPVDSDLAVKPVDPDKWVPSVNTDQGVQLVDSDQVVQPLDSHQWVQVVDLHLGVQIVDSHQGVQPVDPDLGVKPVDSEKWVPSVNTNQEVQIVDSDQVVQPLDSHQRVQPVDSDPGVKPVDSKKWVPSVNLDQVVQTVDSDQVVQPVDSHQWVQPVNSNLRVQPDQREQLVDLDQGVQPVDSDQVVQPDHREQPVDSNPAVQPMDSNKGVQPVDLDQGVQPDQREKPVDSDQGVQPVDSEVQPDQREQPVDSNPTVQPVDSDQGVQPDNSDQRDQHVDSDKKEQHVE